MATMRTANTRVLNLQIDSELRDYLDQFAELRKETRRKIVERALRNEFKSPPPVEKPEPLPPLDSAPKKRTKS